MDDTLESLFESGKLLHSIDETPNSVDLAWAMAKIAGVNRIEESEQTRSLGGLIGDVDHLVFVIVDGLGINILEGLPESSFLRTNLEMELRAITPSTTACAITAFATGRYPCQSGIAGWFTYLPEHRVTATVLPFWEVSSQTPLQDYGISVDSVFPEKALMPQMRHTPMTIMPQEICESVTSRHLRGKTEAVGYSTITEAIDATITAATQTNSKSYTYLYLPHVDTLSHEKGPDHAKVIRLALAIDGELERLAQCLRPGTRLVVTADHGQITVPVEKRNLLPDRDPILKISEFPPTSEARFPIFHVSSYRTEEFVNEFHERFSESFLLITTEEAEDAKLFGPGKIKSHLRPRFGDFVGVAKDNSIIGYLPPGKSAEESHTGRHGGLSPEEMRVPLVVV
jgi:predicted AlkP superfamily pyrophosphatase or phosphodiesterase